MKINRLITAILTIAVLIITLASCVTSPVRERGRDFSVNMDSPQFNIGEIELQMSFVMEMGDLKKHSVPVIYFPKEDAVCIRFRKDYFTYSQFWDKKGRELFIEALRLYNEDFNEKNLDSRDRKSRQRYGITRGYLNWQQFSYTIRNRGNMNLELGYGFKNRSPYFIITQQEAKYIDEISRDNDATSVAFPLYFTRAQAGELANMFQQEFLNSLQQDASPQFNNDFYFEQ